MSESISLRRATKTVKSRTSEVTEEMKNICFSNLLLLGFDIEAEQNSNKIKFHRDMFDDVNKTGCEVVLHFLFQKLNSELAKEEFKICYPVLDRKQEQMFRKTCSSWIVNIAKENREFNFPSALSSILMKKGGRKFYPLLFSLSRFVLLEVVKTELGPSSASHLLHPTKLTKLAEVEAGEKLFQGLLDEHTNSFVTSQLYVARHVKEERLQNLVTQYYYLKKQIKAVSANIEALLDDLRIPKAAQLKIVQGEDCDEWNSILENTKKREQQINEDWNSIERLLDLKEKLWYVCDSVVIQQKQGTRLDGRGLRDSLATVDLGQPLLLSRLCRSWVDSLIHVLNQFENVEIPNVKIFSDDLVKLHINQLDNIEKFRISLGDEIVPSIQQDYLNVWKNSNLDVYREQIQAWQSESTNQLSVPSPPMSLTQSFDAGSSRVRIRQQRISSKTDSCCRTLDKQSFLSKISGKSLSEESPGTSIRCKTKKNSGIIMEEPSRASGGSGSSTISVQKSNGYFSSTSVDSKSICSQSDSNQSVHVQQFDADSEFNLSLLESSLSRTVFELVGLPSTSSPQNKSINDPPRLLQLLGNMKLDEPCSSSTDRIDSSIAAEEEEEEFTRTAFLLASESDREPYPDSAFSPTLGSTPRSLPTIVSSNLRDFLSWEQVLQSGAVAQQPQDGLPVRETKSAIDLSTYDETPRSQTENSTFLCQLPSAIENNLAPIESVRSVTLSRTDMSLADIFAEDDSCLLPSSPVV